MKYALGFLIGIAIFILAVMFMGCAPVHPPGVTTVTKTSITSTPTALKGVAVSLDWIIVLSIVVLGVGVGLFFALPEAHNISIPIALIGAGVEASSLVARVSLWIIPWLAGALGLAALGVFVYEVYRNRTALEADATGLVAKV